MESILEVKLEGGNAFGKGEIEIRVSERISHMEGESLSHTAHFTVLKNHFECTKKEIMKIEFNSSSSQRQLK